MTSPPFALNLELNPIPGQEAWVVLNLEGHVVATSSNTINSASATALQQDARILFQMLQEASSLSTSLEKSTQQVMSRMSVSFQTSRYVIAQDASHIYLVQAKNTAI
jgi:hypothetical protein